MEWSGSDFAITSGRGYEVITINDTMFNPTEYSNEAAQAMLARRNIRKPQVAVYLDEAVQSGRAPVWVQRDDSYMPAGALQSTDDRSRESGVSHVVRAYGEVGEHDHVVFTAYRPEQPYDVLTEEMVGSGIAYKDGYAAVWFEVGNFQEPWQDSEEVILILEASQYFSVVSFSLNQDVDIQELGGITLHALPAPTMHDGHVCWDKIDNDNIIGYSLYQGDMRLNEQVIEQCEYAGEGDVSVRPVFRGGHETVYGYQAVQSSPDMNMPISYAFKVAPNLFIANTRIDYALPELSSVDIVIFDVSGRQIKTLSSGVQEPGYYSMVWSGCDEIGRKVSAGIYFVEFVADNYQKVEKVILLR